MNFETTPMSTRDAARALGLSENGTRLHDAILRPAQISTGQRVYDAARVAAFALARRLGVRR